METSIESEDSMAISAHNQQLRLNTAVSRSRPSSLTILAPEREPVNFTVNLIGAPPEVEQLVEHIKAVAEQFLYHWKTFPIVLPQPLSGSNVAGGQSLPTQIPRSKFRPINLRDLFIAPPFDELDAVAMDGTGEPRRLTNTQLKSLRERGLQKEQIFGKPKKLSMGQLESIRSTGEFDVASLNFTGQVHRWRVSQILQKGRLRTQDSLLNDLALSARFIVVTALTRISGHFLSVVESARALLRGLVLLVDMIVGVPSLLAHDLDYKIKEERCRFLIAELICRPEYEDCLDSLCTYVRRQLRRATTEKFDVECESAQPVPYLFLTPKGQEIDLRLFSRDVMKKALPILVGILERETRGWFLHFRERLIAELREKKMTDTEIEEEVNEAVMQEYLQRVYSSILNHTELAQISDKIPQLLVQQAQSVVIMHKAVEKIQKDLKRTRSEHQKYLINDYPVLSRVSPWLRLKLQAAETSKMSKSVWAAHEEALKMCNKHNLQQTSYFLSRDLAFMKEREPVLLKELRNAKTPTRSFQWPCRIWAPTSWIIRRNFQGQSEIIPTVICQQATSIVTPRSDPSQPVFLVEREIIRTTSTRWPLWRLLNFMQRIWCWTWNMMFLLGFVVPWDSPLGLRALFCVKPFMPELELSQVNGTLFPRKTSITQTLASRLIELWRHISKSRTRFETEPDTGFIGKGFTRTLNRVWNYFAKGFLGTVAIVFIFPLLCVAASAGSVFLAITAPLWVPLITLGLHIYMMLVYDLDCPAEHRNRYSIVLEAVVWNIIIQGCIQPIAAVFIAAFICPLAAICVFCVGVTRYWFRLLWDSITFHLFIEKGGRVPSNDSFVVRRIAGPGLLLDYYFSIKPEQALAAFEAKMELDELQAFQQAMETHILQPQKDFSQFVEACFGPFSAQLAKFGPYKGLEREARDLLGSLHEKLEKRRRDLQTGLTTAVKSKIKLNTMELKVAIQQGAHLLERFYPEHVIGRLSITEDDFWDSKGLQVGDWAGLAGHLYTDIFSFNFLTPLSETDTQFKLEPHSQLDLTRYTEMVQNASDTMGDNGPDLLGNVYAPRGNIQVNSPYLEVSAFNPRSKITTSFRKPEKRPEASGLTTPRIYARRAQAVTATPGGAGTASNSLTHKTLTWRPWKRKIVQKNPAAEKMLIPLPIPHPVHIAIAIHNRDSDQPIPLDSEICWEILKAIEDCHGDIKTYHMVARYRGGGSGALTGAESSLGSLDEDEEEEEEDEDSSSTPNSQSSFGTRESVAGAGRTETLPCGGSMATGEHAASPSQLAVSTTVNEQNQQKTFHWTLSNYAQANRRRNNAGTVRVDLASPEDISLDTDNSSRVVFSAYGTTV